MLNFILFLQPFIRSMQTIIQLVSKETLIDIQQVVATIELLDEGATIPFIARYRKEKTVHSMKWKSA
jgi:transcriptional accessory protein Tex/SPT6